VRTTERACSFPCDALGAEGVILPVALLALTVGPRYILAAEVSLILPLEAVIGPF
jgi:hypothetical protein